ncbi:MAG: hypothetical protein EKK62_16470 [Acidimicrobiia bacterium]|nr:MAG: hypothetical protein EKK62_16470 [Acidimicrobiia bacterium]
MADIALVIDGEAYQGWTQVEIRRSLDQIADGFGATLVSPFSSVKGPPALDEWSPVQLIVDGAVVVDGYVTQVSDGYNADSVWVSVSGASRTIDLVHCSVPATRRWRNRDLVQIVSDVTQPHGIDVYCDELPPKVERFASKPGETVFELIDRLIREHGMRAVALGDGLGLTRTGTGVAPAALVTGQTILECTRDRNAEERFSDYIFKAQVAGADDAYGEAAVSPKAEVGDLGVTRFRPMLVRTDSGRGSAGLKARAEWERNTRAGKSHRLTYRVAAGGGDLSTCWYAGPQLWAPNMIVTVRDSILGLDERLLVTDVVMTLSVDGGHSCEVTITHPDAYLPERPPKKKKKGTGLPW